jgi:hypothetical protein
MSQLEVDKVIPQSGTTLTLGDSADTITIPSGATLDASNATLTLPDGSVTAAKLDSTAVDNTNTNSTVITGQTAETSIDGADLVLLYDDSASALRKMTRTNFVAGIGGTNTPAFGASLQAGDQTISDGVATKVIFSNEIVDTNSAYDATTNYRFTVPAGHDGIYLFSACFWLFDASANISEGGIQLYKNGSQLITINTGPDMQRLGLNFTLIDNASVGDYYEVYAYGDTSDSGTVNVAGSGSTSNYRSFFTGFKIIE